MKQLPVEIWSMILKMKYQHFIIDIYNYLYYVHELRMQDVMTELKAYLYELDYCGVRHGEHPTFMRYRMSLVLPRLNIQSATFFYYVEDWG